MGGNYEARYCNLLHDPNSTLRKRNYSKAFRSASRRLTHSGFQDHRTTTVTRGNCACWHKLPMHCLRLLNPRKLKKNARSSNRRWRRECVTTPPKNKTYPLPIFTGISTFSSPRITTTFTVL